MSCKVNFHLVHSALQTSMCLRTKLKFERGNLMVYQALQALLKMANSPSSIY